MSEDPFRVIESPPPQFTVEEARGICRDQYGLIVSATPLVSERDQNFRLSDDSGQCHILKIANAVEDPLATDFQIRALQHVSASDTAGISVPEVIPALDGESQVRLEKSGSAHVARIVSWLPGAPLEEGRLGPDICIELGAWLARLDRVLQGFSHPGENQVHLWDMKRAPELRRLLPHVDDPATRELLGETLNEFESQALPSFDALRWQVIHNDANPDNVLVAPGGKSIAGIIDFGDMLRSPLIIEVAVAAAYLRVLEGNPLTLVTQLLAGYHPINPLAPDELAILHTLIKTRLATTVLILAWRESIRGAQDAYLRAASSAERSALVFLERLAEIPPMNARQIYSQVCASVERRP